MKNILQILLDWSKSHSANASIQPFKHAERLLDWWENRAVASPRTIIGNFTPLASTFASTERVKRLKAHGEQLRCQNCHKEPFCCQDDREERRDEERENDWDRKRQKERGGIFVTTDVKRDQMTPCHSRLVGSRNQMECCGGVRRTLTAGEHTHTHTLKFY